jgi:hypothetical protein
VRRHHAAVAVHEADRRVLHLPRAGAAGKLALRFDQVRQPAADTAMAER